LTKTSSNILRFLNVIYLPQILNKFLMNVPK